MPDEFVLIEVCRYMNGWDYHTLMSQPREFIDLVIIKMEAESRVESERNNRMKAEIESQKKKKHG